MLVWTTGHSTRSADEFCDLLKAHSIRLLVDVRRFPGSRRHPHFGRDALKAHLENCAVGYLHMPELGGRRNPKPDSINTAWKDRGFRGYADYMQTDEFGQALARLIDAASTQPTAIMCAEASWRSCHRGLIADALKARGVEVIHIVDARRTEPHPYTKAASIESGRLSYAAPAASQQKFDL